MFLYARRAVMTRSEGWRDARVPITRASSPLEAAMGMVPPYSPQRTAHEAVGCSKDDGDQTFPAVREAGQQDMLPGGCYGVSLPGGPPYCLGVVRKSTDWIRRPVVSPNHS